MPAIHNTQINPAFYRHPEEAAIIGRLVVAFGELEFTICQLAADAFGMLMPILRTLYRSRMTSSRLDTAYNLALPVCERHQLGEDWKDAYAAVLDCLRIRNRYAHSNWADHPATPGLFFTDLSAAADAASGFEFDWRHIDVAILQNQESYFVYALELLRFVESQIHIKLGRSPSVVLPMPLKQELPPAYNSPIQHVPPWLNEGQRALHIARALAAQGGPPTPTPQQQALDKARAEKKAKREESIRKAREGDQHSKSRSTDDTEK
jgi:hypothetical protein